MKFLNKLKSIIKLIKKIIKSDNYILYTINDNNITVETSNNLEYISNDNYKEILLNVKQQIINYKYNGNVNELLNNLEQFDEDLANAYKELEYLDAQNQYIEQEYLYFKDMNTPGVWIDGNMAYMRYNRIQELKKKVDMIKSTL